MGKNLIVIKLYAPYTTAIIYEKQKCKCKEQKILKVLLIESDFRTQRRGFFQNWAALINKKMGRTQRNKNIIDTLDVIAIYKTLHCFNKAQSFFSYVCETFGKISYALATQKISMK